jgi:hypothetical protein
MSQAAQKQVVAAAPFLLTALRSVDRSEIANHFCEILPPDVSGKMPDDGSETLLHA